MPVKTSRKAARKATRAKWEAALTKITAEPVEADESTPSQFLPKIVAALRDKGYVQDEIVKKVMSLRLGVTDREIRTTDQALRRGDSGAGSEAGSQPADPPSPDAPAPRPSSSWATPFASRGNARGAAGARAADAESQRR